MLNVEIESTQIKNILSSQLLIFSCVNTDYMLVYNKRGDHVHVIANSEQRVNTELVSIGILFFLRIVSIGKLDANNYFLTFG